MTQISKRIRVRLAAGALALFTAGAALAAFPKEAVAAGTTVASSRFDNKIYKQLLADWDADHNGSLTEEELAAVTALDLSGLSLSTLRGIDYLPNLVKLDLSDNRLRNLNALESLSKLQYLN